MIQITTEQKVLLSAIGVTEGGHRAPLGIPLIWSSSDEGVIMLNPSKDDNTCEAITTDAIGDCTVTANSTNTDNAIIRGTIDITVTSPVATIVLVTASDPILKLNE